MRLHVMVVVVLLSLAGSVSAEAARMQATSRVPKQLTPEQRTYQAEIAAWRTQRDALRIEAQAALATEMAREKRGDCPDATTTLAQNQCLGREMATTQENYARFAGALRKMLALAYPKMMGEPIPSGPTGTPPSAAESVAEFDGLEAEEKLYREHASTAAYHQFQGGTLAPVFAAEAAQKLMRLHMQELAFVYGELLLNH